MPVMPETVRCPAGFAWTDLSTLSNHEHLAVGLEGRPGHGQEYSMLKPTALGL